MFVSIEGARRGTSGSTTISQHFIPFKSNLQVAEVPRFTLRTCPAAVYTISEVNRLRVTNEPSSRYDEQLTSSRVMSCYWDDKGSRYVHTYKVIGQFGKLKGT